MADRSRFAIAALLSAVVCACGTSTTQVGAPATTQWPAVGVPGRMSTAEPAATTVQPIQVKTNIPTSAQAGSVAMEERRPTWASGPGAPAFPRPGTVDQHSADAVALGGARALASADTTIDSRPQQTAVRAALAGWLTPSFARAQSAVPISASGADWSSWTRHRAYIAVESTLSGDDHPPDTSHSAVRMVLLIERPVGRDGWRGKAMTVAVAVVLNKIDGAWRIQDEQPS